MDSGRSEEFIGFPIHGVRFYNPFNRTPLKTVFRLKIERPYISFSAFPTSQLYNMVYVGIIFLFYLIKLLNFFLKTIRVEQYRLWFINNAWCLGISVIFVHIYTPIRVLFHIESMRCAPPAVFFFFLTT